MFAEFLQIERVALGEAKELLHRVGCILDASQASRIDERSGSIALTQASDEREIEKPLRIGASFPLQAEESEAARQRPWRWVRPSASLGAAR